jgi:hypothetical protein
VRLAVVWDQDWELLWRAAGVVLGVDLLTPPFDTDPPHGVSVLISSCGHGPDPWPTWQGRKIWYSCSGRHGAPDDAEVRELRIFSPESLLSELAEFTGRSSPADGEERFHQAIIQLSEIT